MKISRPTWIESKIIIRNTAQQYSVVTPDVDHTVLIAIEQDQPNTPPPGPLDSLSWYMQPNASIQFLLYENERIYLYDSLCYTISILQNRIR